MKNVYIIITLVLTLGINTNNVLAQGSDDNKTHTISKEQMQIDAFAMANIECDYKLKLQQFAEDKNNHKLQTEFNTVKENMAKFTRLINTRYRKSQDTSKDFDKMVKSARSELTICSDLAAYEEEKALKKAEMEESEEAKSKGNK